jgi:uncharacterized protein YbaA (DUF1428 family)
MSYIDGFVIPVPAGNKDAFRETAEKAAQVFKEHGALKVVECWGDDVPAGRLTDFRMAVKAEPGENVVFSWIVWPVNRRRTGTHDRRPKGTRSQRRRWPAAGRTPA